MQVKHSSENLKSNRLQNPKLSELDTMPQVHKSIENLGGRLPSGYVQSLHMNFMLRLGIHAKITHYATTDLHTLNP
jgi:hypothetical protein